MLAGVSRETSLENVRPKKVGPPTSNSLWPRASGSQQGPRLAAPEITSHSPDTPPYVCAFPGRARLLNFSMESVPRLIPTLEAPRSTAGHSPEVLRARTPGRLCRHSLAQEKWRFTITWNDRLTRPDGARITATQAHAPAAMLNAQRTPRSPAEHSRRTSLEPKRVGLRRARQERSER